MIRLTFIFKIKNMKTYTFLDDEFLKLIMEQEFAQTEKNEKVIVNSDGQVNNNLNKKEDKQ